MWFMKYFHNFLNESMRNDSHIYVTVLNLIEISFPAMPRRLTRFLMPSTGPFSSTSSISTSTALVPSLWFKNCKLLCAFSNQSKVIPGDPSSIPPSTRACTSFCSKSMIRGITRRLTGLSGFYNCGHNCISQVFPRPTLRPLLHPLMPGSWDLSLHLRLSQV